MSNVHGLSAFREKDDNDEDESNERYVGGVDSRGGGSGLAVEPNTNDAPHCDSVESVFNVAEQASVANGEDEEDRPRRTITMYRDGFIVDNGPYRRLDDPANADFLRSLARRMTPRELLEEGDIAVGLIDKRQEEYVETFQSFSGNGAALGTDIGNFPENQDGVIDPLTLQVAPSTVDMAVPTTNIQIRLMNGQRRIVKINVDATILELATHLSDSSGRFRLLSGFPPKLITNLNQSLEEAGLKGAQVTQKLAREETVA